MSDDPLEKHNARFAQYDVGYGKPPQNSQFKPGQSGNPKGRPKGSKNSATIIKEALERKITITENGCERQITTLEAIVMAVTTSAIRGKPAAMKLAIDLATRHHELDKAGPVEVDFKAINEHFRKVFERAQKRAAETPADQS